MKILVLKDKSIDNADGVLDKVKSIYTDNQAEISFVVEETDYSDIEWSVYNTNELSDEGPDYGIDKGYIKEKSKEVWKKYAYEVDTIVFLVHDDSWNDSGDGIWGWNLANGYKGYEVEQVRWDPDNEANTVGTLYHELAHSHDSFIYRNTGIWIEGILGISDWDSSVVHGRDSMYEYIQYQENQDAIKKIAPFLNQAAKKRRQMQAERTSLQKRVITLAKQAIQLYRELGIFIKKDDEPCLQ